MTDQLRNEHPSNERRYHSRRASDYQFEHFRRILDSFEQVGRHVLLLNKERQVLYRSGKVDQLLADNQLGITLEPKFCLTESSNSKSFLAFVESLNQPYDEEHPPSCILLLNRTDGSPLLLSCFPLLDTEPDGDSADIMVLLCDTSEMISQSQWKAFQKLFELTGSELRLCLELSDGLSLTEYAEKHSISINTARNQLKSVFDKTCIRRQGDLVRLIFLLTRV